MPIIYTFELDLICEEDISGDSIRLDVGTVQHEGSAKVVNIQSFRPSEPKFTTVDRPVNNPTPFTPCPNRPEKFEEESNADYLERLRKWLEECSEAGSSGETIKVNVLIGWQGEIQLSDQNDIRNLSAIVVRIVEEDHSGTDSRKTDQDNFKKLLEDHVNRDFDPLEVEELLRSEDLVDAFASDDDDYIDSKAYKIPKQWVDSPKPTATGALLYGSEQEFHFAEKTFAGDDAEYVVRSSLKLVREGLGLSSVWMKHFDLVFPQLPQLP